MDIAEVFDTVLSRSPRLASQRDQLLVELGRTQGMTQIIEQSAMQGGDLPNPVPSSLTMTMAAGHHPGAPERRDGGR